ncbi:RICIN domain-containing protein [Hymenobacter weizhouensis]|uniref:RICIN domain-containing protein n=1 Tax=Hymenobacter sp. YIM 151500-1 TaxID=2987689 RepID=UPI002226D014|nr:RICIN domain-containing protein [Hymenobacter sp. YIM 151500-1]UYZ62504.1 family 16 glycosylhydrolase [Hymenobacter sp. YIM 151500-1]
MKASFFTCRSLLRAGRRGLAALLPLLFPALLAAQAGPPGTGWRLTFSDEFNGTSLDRSKWTDEYPWGGRTHNYDGYCAPENVLVQNGLLRLKAEDKPQGGKRYTTGMVQNYKAFSQAYGYFEGRFKVAPGQGMSGFWPAFWLAPSSTKWPPEIDIVEFFGHSGEPAANLHWPEPSQEDNHDKREIKLNTGIDYSQDFHVYAVEWDASKIVWYIDGKEMGRFTEHIPADPMGILINFGIGVDWLGYPAAAALPAYFECDWVRVYQRSTAAPVADGRYTLVPECAPASSLDVYGWATADESRVNIWNTGGNQANQQWDLARQSDGTYRLSSAMNAGKVLDVKSSGTANETPLQLYGWNGTDAQRFYLTAVGNGYFKLTPKCAPGKAVDVNNAAAADGTKVQLWEENGTKAQRWRLQRINTGARPATTAASLPTAVKAYPIPARDQLTVQYDVATADRVQLVLRNPLGQTVRRHTYPAAESRQQHTLDVRGLPAGLYFLDVHTGQANNSEPAQRLRVLIRP